MISAKLVERRITDDGFMYVATDEAGAFLSNLASEYHLAVGERARWVVDRFDDVTDDDLGEGMRTFFEAWTAEFQSAEAPIEPNSLP